MEVYSLGIVSFLELYIFGARKWGKNLLLRGCLEGLLSFVGLFSPLYILSWAHGFSIRNMIVSFSDPVSWDSKFFRNLNDRVFFGLSSLLSLLESVVLRPLSPDRRLWIPQVCFLVNLSWILLLMIQVFLFFSHTR